MIDRFQIICFPEGVVGHLLRGFGAFTALIAAFLIWGHLPATAQSNQWTWIGGSNVNDQAGVYGTLGQPSSTNVPGGRYLPATWADHQGRLWMFGGGWGAFESFQSLYNDLWEFDPASEEWTWMGGNSVADQRGIYGTQGKAAAGNVPGARSAAASWTDDEGHFWLFGGAGADSAGNFGLLNDVWEFDPATMQWTWVAGSNTVGSLGAQPGVYGSVGVAGTANTPGGRLSPTVWIDAKGKIWLFGGYYADYTGINGGFNDFWEFDPSTNEWTWIGGNNTLCDYGVQSGVWGTMGTDAAANIPSCNYGASGWTDNSGNLWMFGGEGRDILGYWGDLNSLWEFNPTTKQWAWMGGQPIIDLPYGVPPGQFGTFGTPAAGNIPGGRNNATTWKDANGNIWLFGGLAWGFEGDSGLSMFNDLWEFNPGANEWVWMGGSTDAGHPGVYGTQGTPSPQNIPGDRWGSAGWTDSNGRLWLFGGEGYPNSLLICDLGDYWEYTADAPAALPGFAVVDLNDQVFNNAQSFVVPAGTSGTTTINTVVSGGFNGLISLSATGLPDGITASFSPSSVSGFSSSQVTFAVALNVTPGNYTIPVAGTSGGVTETTTVALEVGSPPPPNFSLSATTKALTVPYGGQGTVTLTLTPLYGFNSVVTFTCANQPAGATCIFNPASVTPAGNPVNINLGISVPAQTTALRSNSGAMAPMTIFALALGFWSQRRRRDLRPILFFALLTVIPMSISACGGGGGSTGSKPPPVTATLLITASGSNAAQTVQVTLTVD